ncbi:MAG TPA: hypothetical protein VGF75_02175 [Candidatus Saccharimonadales bacterium]|jgi:hypothetical protein
MPNLEPHLIKRFTAEKYNKPKPIKVFGRQIGELLLGTDNGFRNVVNPDSNQVTKVFESSPVSNDPKVLNRIWGYVGDEHTGEEYLVTISRCSPYEWLMSHVFNHSEPPVEVSVEQTGIALTAGGIVIPSSSAE